MRKDIFLLLLPSHLATSTARKVLTQRNFWISVVLNFWFFVSAVGLSLSRCTYVPVRTPWQLFTRGDFWESSYNCWYGDPIFLHLVVIITRGHAKVVVFISVLICRLKYWLLSPFFFFFCRKQSEKFQRRCQVCWNETFLMIHLLLLLSTICRLQNISSFFF